MKTAIKIKDLDNFQGRASLYKLSEPVKYPRYSDENQRETKYIIASAVIAFDHGKPETYLFPSDENGEVLDWGELPGSYRGGLDHEKALNDAGFSLE